MNFFEKFQPGKKTTATPAVSTVESDQPTVGFWDKNRKLLILFGGCLLMLVAMRACSSRQADVKSARHDSISQSQAERDQSGKDSQIEFLRKQLEKKRADDDGAAATAKTDQDARDANSGATLTPEQQRAIANAGGKQQAAQQGGNYPGYAAAPQHEKPTSLVISYRDQQQSETPAPPVPPPAESASVPPPVTQTEDQQHGVAEFVGEKYRIRQGTLLPCTEELRINGTFASHINCLVSISIYSPSGAHLLMPQGTVAVGHTVAVANQGQQRLFVGFDALIMPDGFTVTIKDADGLDQIGQTGLRDKVNHHYAQIFGVSIALAAVSGLSQIGNYGNSTITPLSQYRAGMTQGLSESAVQVLDRFSNILPTFTVREGARVNIYIPMSLYVPDYLNHRLKGDL